MKTKLTVLAFSLFLLTSCLQDDNNVTANQETTITQWHLINVTGGFAGVNHNFEMDVIIWTFDNGTLYVQNNNPDDTLEDGLDTGTYSQSFLEEDEKLFLFIENIDYGLITISEDEQIFTLDQNITSTANGADGFIYKFKKEIVVIN